MAETTASPQASRGFAQSTRPPALLPKPAVYLTTKLLTSRVSGEWASEEGTIHFWTGSDSEDRGKNQHTKPDSGSFLLPGMNTEHQCSPRALDTQGNLLMDPVHPASLSVPRQRTPNFSTLLPPGARTSLTLPPPGEGVNISPSHTRGGIEHTLQRTKGARQSNARAQGRTHTAGQKLPGQFHQGGRL